MSGPRIAGIAALILAGFSPPGRADIGLGARFGDVILEGASPGRTYDLREAAHVPFAVENKGDAEAEVVIEFEKPATRKLAPDYEAIPDPTWLKAVPGKLSIAPKAVGYFNLLLTIPEDPKLKGRNFQVIVKARMTGTGLLAVAVEGRLRFSTGAGPESMREEARKSATQKLDFDLSPGTLYLTETPVGRAWDSKKEAKKTLRVANYSPDPLAIRLEVVKWDPSTPMPDGYEPLPEPAWVKVKVGTLTVDTDEIGTTGLVVTVPDDPKHRGKRWAALVRTQLASGFWLDATTKLFVETKP